MSGVNVSAAGGGEAARMTRLLPAVLLLSLSGCLRRWLPVAEGMRAQQVACELRLPPDDFNSRAPKGFRPAKDNKFVVFVYDPAAAPKVHRAFLSISEDCFMYELPPDADGGQPRHSAICAYERTPPPPAEE